MEEWNEIIVKLKEELQDLRTNSSIKTKYLQKEARARGQSTNRIWAQQTSGLEEQIYSLRKQLEMEARANSESEAFLEKKRVQLQREIEKWGERYENDIEEQEQMLESLKKSRAEVMRRDIRRDIL